MKTSALTVAVFLAQAAAFGYVEAFVPTSRQFVQVRNSNSNSNTAGASISTSSPQHNGGNGNGIAQQQLVSMLSRELHTSLQAGAGFLGMDDEEEEEDDEDDDDDEPADDDEDDDEEDVALSSSRYSGAKSPFTGMKLDPYDPNPTIKPRPNRYFREQALVSSSAIVPDEQLVQTMSETERTENLKIMRQIRKSDLPDLRMRKDHAGWVEANNDLKRRYDSDPWFGVNERLRDAVLLGESQDKIDFLVNLAAKLGGPADGMETGTKGYAVHTEIYDIGISPSRASAVMERQVRMERAARGRVMMAERKKNIDKEARQYEEDMLNPGVREDKEAKERRERTMGRLMDQIEEDNKKKMERAKEILGKVPDAPESRTKSMEKALKEARDEVKMARRKELGMSSGAGTDDKAIVPVEVAGEKSGADKAREAAAAEASGGRPRLPGDSDVTRGALGELNVQSSSTTVSGPLQVEVTSVYNKDQSDPPMRKHCFQYTIRITNNSPSDTIQLLGRRFEIQTVGSSMKDIVQGEGVTGRTPVLKPGEVFEYTSTAPLSVRPIGTTEIAARMRGEYRFVTLTEGQETASEEQMKTGGEAKAELGMFHFIFPDDQRVQPIRSAEEDDEEEEEEDDDEPAAKSPAPSTASSTPSASPASTLPGDVDMTTGDVTVELNDSSEAVTEAVRVQVNSSYRPERSDGSLDKHCFAYNIRITNESEKPIQLVSRRFEIQTIGGANKDVVQGPGVTGRQPILKPGESFEYTSTAPLSVKPKSEKTAAVARMQGEYNFVVLGDDGATPISSTPLQAKLGMFHFILPDSSMA